MTAPVPRSGRREPLPAAGALRLARAAGLAATLVLAAGVARASCGAEGCPLVPQGPEVQPGRFTFDVGWQSIDQDRLWSGVHSGAPSTAVGSVNEEFTRTRAWSFGAGARVAPHLRLTASLPYLQREHRHALVHHPGFTMASEWSFEGLGDASLLAHWTAYGEPNEGPGAITLQFGAQLPTGRRDAPEVDGEVLEVPARLGSGSTDALVGVQLVRRVTLPAFGGAAVAPFGLSVLGRFHGRGTDGYRMGDEVHASLTGAYPLGSRVQLVAQLNTVSQSRDGMGEASASPAHGAVAAAVAVTDDETMHTGGTAVFASPGMVLRLPGGATTWAYWQIRAYERTNGAQLVAPSHVVMGTSIRLGR